MTKFTIFSDPQGKQRPRFGNGRTFTPQKTVDYEKEIAFEYKRQCNKWFEGAIKVHIIAYFAIPQSKSNRVKALMAAGEIRPTKKPDLDNIAKVVCDALNKIAYQDDSQIVSLTVDKYYGESPRVEVEIKGAITDEADI